MSNGSMSSQEQHTDRVRTFRLKNNKGANIAVGIALIVIGVFSEALTGSGGGFVGIGVLFIAMTVLISSMDYIILGKDYIAVKPAPVKSRVSVLFSEITSVNRGDKKIIISYRVHGEQGGGEKTITIVPKLLERSDQQRLSLELDRCLAGK